MTVGVVEDRLVWIASRARMGFVTRRNTWTVRRCRIRRQDLEDPPTEITTGIPGSLKRALQIPLSEEAVSEFGETLANIRLFFFFLLHSAKNTVRRQNLDFRSKNSFFSSHGWAMR